MNRETNLIVKKYKLNYKGNSIHCLLNEGIKYYPFFQLISVFIKVKDPKDYFKKNIKRDEILNGIYKEYVRYDLDNKKTAYVNTIGFNFIISFLANQSLDDLKKFVDQKAEPISELEVLINLIINEINSNF